MSDVEAPETRRAVTRRDELIGSGMTVGMAVLFSSVVIFGKAILDGKLPFVILSIRFAGTASCWACWCARPGGR